MTKAPGFIALYLEDGTVANTAPVTSNAERAKLTRDFLDDAGDHEELVMLDTANLTWRSYATWNPDDDDKEEWQEEPTPEPWAVEIEVRRKFWVSVEAVTAAQAELIALEMKEGKPLAERLGEEFDVETSVILTRPLPEFADANEWDDAIRVRFDLPPLAEEVTNG
jgi:hypothetical protein